ncbi:hypothetical protein [Mesorhizobium sp.]|uniref:hypothetical protein n=1 Tax=Mesorhizobium sp. TaxID=1871066 RepID=UPI0011FDDA71|nr:hypothetical protein [Mesorhizobium sp.]TIL53806.1 MAG: hypothetical protein E5Y83_05820 [Mesorhizobium sp.]
MSETPQTFCTMFKDGEDPARGLTDYWCEVCIDGREQAAAQFFFQIPTGDNPHEYLKRIGTVLTTTEPFDTAIIADILDPGWRNRLPAQAAVDDDLPF